MVGRRFGLATPSASLQSAPARVPLGHVNESGLEAACGRAVLDLDVSKWLDQLYIRGHAADIDVMHHSRNADVERKVEVVDHFGAAAVDVVSRSALGIENSKRDACGRSDIVARVRCVVAARAPPWTSTSAIAAELRKPPPNPVVLIILS